mgnify:CR=1 FL=1
MNYVYKKGNKLFLCLLLGLLLLKIAGGKNYHSKTYDNQTSKKTEKISFLINNQSVLNTIKTIEQQTGLSFNYDASYVEKMSKKITLNIKDETIETVLIKFCKQAEFLYERNNKMVILYKPTSSPKDEIKDKKTGKIKGKITDENGDPLPGANIWLPLLKKGTTADFDGNYSVEIPEGTYTIEISFISYKKQQITGVKVKTGKNTPLSVKLKSVSEDIDEVKVTAEYKRQSTKALYAIQKETISLTDGISAEQIKMLPASNVAQVLKKVSGITVKNDKYVVVRGMSERYNNVQMNGSSLPSTEPNRRNFSFDIIPSNLIDNVVVHKTFSPDLPGEFAGGLVNVSTISIPQKTFFSVSAGTGFNTISTGKDFYSTKRQTADYFGGSNDRVWYKKTFDPELYFSDYDIDEPGENCLAQIANIPNNWGLNKYKGQPKQSYAVSFGKPLEIDANNTIGVVVAGTYSHSEKIENFWERTRRNEGDTTLFAYKYKFKTVVGGIANLAWKNKRGHRINFRNLYNRNFTHNNTVMETENLTEPGVLYYRYYSTININTLWQTRLDGKHDILGKNLVFDWFADYSSVDRVEPDTRNSKGTIKEEYGYMDYLLSYNFSGSNPNKGLSIFATELNESKKNIGANLTAKFKLLGNEQKIKAGYSGSFRKSDYAQISLSVSRNNQSLQELSGLTDVELGNPKYFGKDKLMYISILGNTDLGQGYEGTQDIHAGYILAEFSPLKKIGINGGVRIEHEIMDVRTMQRVRYSEGQYWTDSTITYTATELLPSITLIYKITPDVQLKAAYNKTLTRVDFKERSAFKYYDMEELGFMLGNGGLESGYAQNYDLRLEWYPKPGEIISVSAFYKYFINPVEKITYNNTSGSYLFMYFNLDDASTKGIEFDLRKSLGFISNSSKFLNKLFVSGNMTIMKGDVTYNANKLANEAQGLDYDEEEDLEIDAYRSRDLQGLSPFVYNAGLSYQSNHLGGSINLNHTGRTLVLAGTSMEQDEYDAPRNQLDAQLSYKFFNKRMKVKLNVSDLLAEDFIRYRNYNPDDIMMPYDEDPEGLDYNPDYDWTLRKIKKGTNYSISVSYTF